MAYWLRDFSPTSCGWVLLAGLCRQYATSGRSQLSRMVIGSRVDLGCYADLVTRDPLRACVGDQAPSATRASMALGRP